MQTVASKSKVKEDLKSLRLSELQAKLKSSSDGLSQAEAEQRLAQDGYNEIEEKKTNPFLKFLSYFWGPIPWMIEGAVFLSAPFRKVNGPEPHNRASPWKAIGFSCKKREIAINLDACVPTILSSPLSLTT